MPAHDATPTDAELLARCRGGSEVAWRQLVDRYRRLVYTVPRQAGFDEHAAADVFQQTFSRLFDHLDRLDQPDRVQAWLVTTARRETLRLLEQRRRRVDLAPAGDADDDAEDPLARLPDPSPLPDDLLADLQLQHHAREALESLDERSRTLLTLLFLQDDPPSYDEIAARLGIPVGSIGPTRARALQKLRRRMEGG